MMTSRRMIVYTVVLKNAFFRWSFDLVQKILDHVVWSEFDPSLALNCTSSRRWRNNLKHSIFNLRFVPTCFCTCNTSWTFLFVVPQKVLYLFAVQLKCRNFDWELFEVFKTLNFFLNEDSSSRQDSRGVKELVVRWVEKRTRVRSFHCISLTTASLTIRKDTNVLAIQGCLQEGLNLLKYFLLRTVRHENLVKIVSSWLVWTRTHKL